MGCKPNFLYNTGIRRSSEALFSTGKLCILKEFPYFDRIFYKMEFFVSNALFLLERLFKEVELCWKSEARYSAGQLD
jgi:hypothetical protein